MCECVFFACSNLNIFVIRSILCSVHNIINYYVTAPGAYIIYLPHPNSFTLTGSSKPNFLQWQFYQISALFYTEFTRLIFMKADKLLVVLLAPADIFTCIYL